MYIHKNIIWNLCYGSMGDICLMKWWIYRICWISRISRMKIQLSVWMELRETGTQSWKLIHLTHLIHLFFMIAPCPCVPLAGTAYHRLAYCQGTFASLSSALDSRNPRRWFLRHKGAQGGRGLLDFMIFHGRIGRIYLRQISVEFMNEDCMKKK